MVAGALRSGWFTVVVRRLLKVSKWFCRTRVFVNGVHRGSETRTASVSVVALAKSTVPVRTMTSKPERGRRRVDGRKENRESHNKEMPPLGMLEPKHQTKLLQ